MKRVRLDSLLVERGLFESRSRAAASVMAGEVLLLPGRERAVKPGQMVAGDVEVEVIADLAYVSRGGVKLANALDRLGLSVTGRSALDVGASTGGFTDCLLQHGATRVWAIDVGHNQLAWKLRQDARVVVIEGQNARNLDSLQFPALFDLATIDVSFISLAKIFPALAACLIDGAAVIALVKPQFEVGRGEVGKHGIVSDPEKHRRVLEEIARCAAALDLLPADVIASPILGAEGNREFLMHLRKTGEAQTISPAMDEKIKALTS